MDPISQVGEILVAPAAKKTSRTRKKSNKMTAKRSALSVMLTLPKMIVIQTRKAKPKRRRKNFY